METTSDPSRSPSPQGLELSRQKVLPAKTATITDIVSTQNTLNTRTETTERLSA